MKNRAKLEPACAARSIDCRRAAEGPVGRQRHLVADRARLSIDARVVIMDEPTAALSQRRSSELYRIIEPQGRRQGDPLHQPQVRRDLRIADRYTVFRDGEMVGRRPWPRITEPELDRPLMVGRDVTRPSQALEVAIGAPVLKSRLLLPSDRIRRHRLRAAQGRDPRLLRPGRRRPLGSDAGAVRHHPPSSGTVVLEGKAIAIRSRRCDPRRHRLRAGGARQARRAWPADLPEHHAAVAQAHLAHRLPARRRPRKPLARQYAERSTCAPPR
jgi:ABC-type sugar transport system ATPase subunit